jgi:uncharacterized protein
MVSSHGRFLWYELTTTDAEAAKVFYTKVMGWGTHDASTPAMSYTLFTVGDVTVSGVMNLPAEARRTGTRPRWIGYVGVDDLDAAVKRIERLGGSVTVPPTEIPNINSFAVVTDSQMATIALLKWANTAQEPPSPRAKGGVGWHELLTIDCAKALDFYGAVFGWREGIALRGSRGTYQYFAIGADPIGGILTKPATVPHSFWLYYFNVGDVDAAIRRVETGGGEIVNGPVEVPDGTWIVQCADPQGAMFALVGRRSYHAVGFMERIAALQ